MSKEIKKPEGKVYHGIAEKRTYDINTTNVDNFLDRVSKNDSNSNSGNSSNSDNKKNE